MSNYLAIATVTAVLGDMVGSVSGATVTTERPSTTIATGNPTINIFLYQVTSNPHWCNADLPTRRSDGSLAERPQIALDLHYLLTFYGDAQESQCLLGTTMSALHTQPILSRPRISTVVDNNNFLQGSNLADQVESVKLSPLPLNLEELSKIWSVLFQTPYTLSVAYQASVVLIEAEELPTVALPVQDYAVYALPFRQPVIEQINVAGDSGNRQPILAGSTLIIRGRQLSGDITKVRIGEKEMLVTSAAADRIELDLSALAPLRAGVHGVQIVHDVLMGSPPEPRKLIESNVAAIVLRPEIIGQPTFSTTGEITFSTAGEITLKVNPPIGQDQRVVLLLNEFNGSKTYSFTADTGDADTGDADTGDADTGDVKISTPGAEAGQYYVRIQVDGAESPLWEAEPPQVMIP